MLAQTEARFQYKVCSRSLSPVVNRKCSIEGSYRLASRARITRRRSHHTPCTTTDGFPLYWSDLKVQVPKSDVIRAQMSPVRVLYMLKGTSNRVMTSCKYAVLPSLLLLHPGWRKVCEREREREHYLGVAWCRAMADYIGVILGYIGIMEKKMETTIVY